MAELIRSRPIRWRDPGPGGRVALLAALYIVVVWAAYGYGPYADLDARRLLEESFGWDAAAAAAWLGALGTDGLDAYRHFQVVDLLGAAFLSLVLIAIVQWGVGRYAGAGSRWHDLALVPLAMFAVELVENAALFGMTLDASDPPDWLATVGSAATKGKFVLGVAAFAVAGGAALAGWWNLWITRS